MVAAGPGQRAGVTHVTLGAVKISSETQGGVKLKLKIGIDGNEYVVDVEVLEDDSAGPVYLAPHGQPTTVQPVTVASPEAGRCRIRQECE